MFNRLVSQKSRFRSFCLPYVIYVLVLVLVLVSEMSPVGGWLGSVLSCGVDINLTLQCNYCQPAAHDPLPSVKLIAKSAHY